MFRREPQRAAPLIPCSNPTPGRFPRGTERELAYQNVFLLESLHLQHNFTLMLFHVSYMSTGSGSRLVKEQVAYAPLCILSIQFSPQAATGPRGSAGGGARQQPSYTLCQSTRQQVGPSAHPRLSSVLAPTAHRKTNFRPVLCVPRSLSPGLTAKINQTYLVLDFSLSGYRTSES